MNYFSSKNFKAVLANMPSTPKIDKTMTGTNANKEADMAHYQRDKYKQTGSPKALNKAQKHETKQETLVENDKRFKKSKAEKDYIDADEAVIMGNAE